MKTFLISSFVLLSILTAYGQQNTGYKDKAKVIHCFEGKWKGTATAYFPRDEKRSNREETITAIGKKVLKDTYVKLSSTWTQPNGDYRTLITFWNYHIRKDSFQILYLYDNWPGRVDYALSYDSTSRTFRGYDTFMARGNIPAEEKVEWVISADGKEIRSTEYNHLSTDPEDYWPKTFEFILRREE